MTQNNNETISKKSKNTGKVVESVKLDTTSKVKQSKAKIHPFLLGKPENSGKKKGQKNKATIIKEQIEQQAIQTARERYTATLEAMLPKIQVAQLALGLGAVKVFAKVPYDDGTGNQKTKLKLVEGDDEIIEILSNPEFMQNTDYVIVQHKDPIHNAQAYMLDNLIGKAKDQTEITGNLTIQTIVKKIGE
jgi:hypothetical protein